MAQREAISTTSRQLGLIDIKPFVSIRIICVPDQLVLDTIILGNLKSVTVVGQVSFLVVDSAVETLLLVCSLHQRLNVVLRHHIVAKLKMPLLPQE